MSSSESEEPIVVEDGLCGRCSVILLDDRKVGDDAALVTTYSKQILSCHPPAAIATRKKNSVSTTSITICSLGFLA
jgi:hypothetical protein